MCACVLLRLLNRDVVWLDSYIFVMEGHWNLVSKRSSEGSFCLFLYTCWLSINLKTIPFHAFTL